MDIVSILIIIMGIVVSVFVTGNFFIENCKKHKD